VDQIKAAVAQNIPNPVFRGFCVYATSECPQEFRVKSDQHEVTISQRKVHEVGGNASVFRLFLNSTLRFMMSDLGYIEIGRSGKYFNPNRCDNIDNLHCFKGYCSSFLECDAGIYLRVDTARKIVRKDTVLDAINSIYRQHSSKDKEERRNEVRRALINSIILTNYGRYTFYRVLDVEFVDLKTYTVNEKYPTLIDYYFGKYNLEIKNTSQPLLRVETKNAPRNKVIGEEQRSAMLIPEFCRMTGIPDNFDENRRKSVSQQTILAPDRKLKEIEGYYEELKKAGHIDHLRGLGVEIKRDLNKMNTIHVSSPALELGKKQYVQKGKEANFQLYDKPLFQVKHALDIVVIFQKNCRDIPDMIKTFENTSKVFKIDLVVNRYELPVMKGERDIADAIDRAFKKYDKANMLLVVIPMNLKNVYPGLKKLTLSPGKDFQMPTQFVVEGTLRKKGAQSIHTKILLQMISKRGNILWVPENLPEVD
jgi:hypothetical protein